MNKNSDHSTENIITDDSDMELHPDFMTNEFARPSVSFYDMAITSTRLSM